LIDGFFLEYVCTYGSAGGPSRCPNLGWIRGGIGGLLEVFTGTAGGGGIFGGAGVGQ